MASPEFNKILQTVIDKVNDYSDQIDDINSWFKNDGFTESQVKDAGEYGLIMTRELDKITAPIFNASRDQIGKLGTLLANAISMFGQFGGYNRMWLGEGGDFETDDDERESVPSNIKEESRYVKDAVKKLIDYLEDEIENGTLSGSKSISIKNTQQAYFSAGYRAALNKIKTVEHTTVGKDQVFTDLFKNTDHNVVVSSLGSDYRYTIRFIDKDIKDNDIDRLIKDAEYIWEEQFEPILARAGYETKYMIPNIFPVDDDEHSGLETLGNLNFMVKEFPEGTTFTRSVSKSIKATRDDIVIEFDDDLKDARADAEIISEHWVGDLWDATPIGGKKQADYFFKIPAFDIEYKCTVTVNRKETPEWGGPYGSVEGTVNSKWDDNGNGWGETGIGKSDIDGSIDTYVGDNYAVEDGASVIQFVIEHLADFFYKAWDGLVDSNAKPIRSTKAGVEAMPTKDAARSLFNHIRDEIMLVIYGQAEPEKDTGHEFVNLMHGLLSGDFDLSFTLSSMAQDVLDKMKYYEANYTTQKGMQALYETVEMVAKVIDKWPDDKS